MKLLAFISLILLCIPAVSKATWDSTPALSGETYNNQALQLYNNQCSDSLILNGDSHLMINDGAQLSNSVINNISVVHLYTIDSLATNYPAIKNTQFNDQSTLTLETNAISSGSLFIGQGSKLNIIHVDNYSTEPFLNVPLVTGNVTIENLNLAGIAMIAPTITLLEDDYENCYEDNEDGYEDIESNYQQQPGPVIVTRIENLTMQPGSQLSLHKYIPHMQFNQLQIHTLAGSGKFYLESNLAGGLSDQVVVSGQASGHFGLTIKDTGYEPVTPNRVNVISINSGDAQFELLNNNGIVEAGVWQYTLQHEQNNEQSHWYLSKPQPQSVVAHDDNLPERLTVTPANQLPATESSNVAHNEFPTENLAASPTAMVVPTEPQTETDIYPPTTRQAQPVLSRSAQAVINMASASRQILTAEISTFRQRQGAVRDHHKNVSIWTRYLKDDSHHARHSDSAFQTHLHGLQIGIDKRTEFNAGDWLLGTYISDSKTTVQSGELTHGKIRSQSGGLYATWLDNSGFYWDNVFKLNQLRHEIRTEMNSGQLTRGHYRQNGISAASEAGYSLHLNQMLTLTPYGKVSYFRTRQVNSVLDNGLATSIPQATSMDGEAGLMLEVPFNLYHSRLRPYLKAAVSRELVGDNALTINGINLALPGSGTQGKYGLGSILQIADNLSAWAEMDYQKGRRTETPVNATLGLRVSF